MAALVTKITLALLLFGGHRADALSLPASVPPASLGTVAMLDSTGGAREGALLRVINIRRAELLKQRVRSGT